jgi:hypothetical protein
MHIFILEFRLCGEKIGSDNRASLVLMESDYSPSQGEHLTG